MADHIQIPQTWMRNFSKKNNPLPKSVYCLSLQYKVIDCVKIKELGASEHYYIEDFEHYLDVNWETKIGLIFKKIRDEAKKDKYELNDDELQFIKRFLALSVARSKSYRVLSRLNDKSGLPFIGEAEINPLSVIFSGGMLFKDSKYRFIVNTSNVGFVLPSYSYYYINSENLKCPIMVINSKIAISFVEKDKIEGGQVWYIRDDVTIKRMNYWALVAERYTNNDFLIAENPSDFAFETS